MPIQTLILTADGSLTSGWRAEGGDYTRLQSDDGDTTRLYSPTDTDESSFQISDTSGLSGLTINSVTVYGKFKSVDPVPSAFQIGVISGATKQYSTDKSDDTQTYTLFSEAFTTDPNTGSAWTVSAINDLEITFQKTNGVGGALTFAYAEVDYDGATVASQNTNPDVTYTPKHYTYKVCDSSGNYIKTWANDVLSEPRFTSQINGIPGEMVVTLAREFDNFGEDVDVVLGNIVDVYVFDNETPNGSLLYKGYISRYAPEIREGEQTVKITLLPLFTRTNGYIHKDGSSTEVAYLSQDPSDIFRGAFNDYLDQGGPYITLGSSRWDQSLWDVGFWDAERPYDIQDTGSTVTYTFNTNTIREAIEKCVELAPLNYYFRVDADGTLVFKQKSDTVDHDLSIGNEIIDLSYEQRNENIVNDVYFVGGGDPPLYRRYSRTGSIATYGSYAIKYIDSRVTNVSTAETLATKILDEREVPEIRARIVILDSNESDPNKGYDIESIQPGETIRVKNIQASVKTPATWDNALWDVDNWDYALESLVAGTLIVVKTRYSPGMLTVETSTRFPEVSKRIEDINRNVVNDQTKNNPSTPS